MKDSKFALFKPKKDQCDTCNEYKVKKLSEDLYLKHRDAIEKSREEKQNDVNDAKLGKSIVFCMDVHAVKLVPQLQVSAAYYKMKLQIHNFTIYDIVSHESSNYFWDESEGELVSSIFTTIICKHLEEYLNITDSKVSIILYSDGCGYQIRNCVLSNALINLAQKH